MKKKINYKLAGFIISLVAFIFYAGTILFLWCPQWQESRHLAFNWPDANANFWAVSTIVDNFSIGEFDLLNIPSNNLLHTRSQNVIDGVTLPMTFLPSLFVLAIPAWFFGQFASMLLVALLSAGFLYIFHLLILKLFKDEKFGLISTILLATLAPWFYFASQPLLPNIIVIFLASLAIYSFLDYKFLAGSLFLALAIVCRPPEIIWLLPIFLLFFYFWRPKVSKISAISSFIIFVAIALWALYLNKQVFGGYLMTGYSNLQGNNLPSEVSANNDNIISWLFPFGLNIILAIKNYLKYFCLLIWPYSIFILLGVWTILRDKNKKIERKYLLAYIIISALLVLYYGSWNFADPLVKNLNTISISYVRYFLPIFIMSVPLIVLGIDFLLNKIKNKSIFSVLIVGILILFSFYQVYFTKNDGWLAQSQYVRGYYQEWQMIKKIVPAKAVIISERSDKYLYPYYRVVVPQGDLPLWPRIKEIYGSVDIYYYSSSDVAQIMATKKIMAQSNLDLSEHVAISNNLNLYKVLSK